MSRQPQDLDAVLCVTNVREANRGAGGFVVLRQSNLELIHTRCQPVLADDPQVIGALRAGVARQRDPHSRIARIGRVKIPWQARGVRGEIGLG